METQQWGRVGVLVGPDMLRIFGSKEVYSLDYQKTGNRFTEIVLEVDGEIRTVNDIGCKKSEWDRLRLVTDEIYRKIAEAAEATKQKEGTAK